MSDELRPCPYCDGALAQPMAHETLEDMWVFKCLDCPKSLILSAEDKADAVNIWSLDSD